MYFFHTERSESGVKNWLKCVPLLRGEISAGSCPNEQKKLLTSELQKIKLKLKITWNWFERYEYIIYEQ